MTHRASNWMPLVLLALLAAMTFWLAQTVSPPPGRAEGSKRHDPDMIVDGFDSTQFGENGIVRFTLSAKRAVHFPDDDTSQLTDVHFVSYEPDQPPLHATSEKALVTSNGDEVFLQGNVLVVREAGDKNSRLTVETTFLHVIPDDSIAKTDQPVVMRDATTTVHAASMVANNREQTIALTRVNARYHDPQKK